MPLGLALGLPRISSNYPSQTSFRGTKGVRATEVLLQPYFKRLTQLLPIIASVIEGAAAMSVVYPWIGNSRSATDTDDRI